MRRRGRGEGIGGGKGGTEEGWRREQRRERRRERRREEGRESFFSEKEPMPYLLLKEEGRVIEEGDGWMDERKEGRREGDG
jgi:hypothetical protein